MVISSIDKPEIGNGKTITYFGSNSKFKCVTVPKLVIFMQKCNKHSTSVCQKFKEFEYGISL
ncbi:hypothetical protein ADICYQ_3355 [Cyclobacterium qasimii M12-11B]|uniref:Uncharacterized protein n=1 Tax=Cyclobacterium qasimii M12-11B TaxID=641524 RepID=S7VDC4_9BACT|nr:hypothetical protein ADICYQ_3355 [Cyclobacterium qasimii M12-11B]